MKVGFIGLGNVGGKLAGSLLRNKFNSLQANNRSEIVMCGLDRIVFILTFYFF